jgi:hypothetical protein
MTELKCQFCQKVFTTKSNLSCHIKTAKRCLEKRNNLENIKKYEPQIYNCDFCDKELSTKSNLDRHMLSCKNKDIVLEKNNIIKKLENDIIQLKNTITEKEQKQLYTTDILQSQIKQLLEQNKDLQDTIKHLAEKAISKPTTTINNNITNNLQLITEDFVKEQVQYLTIEHIKKGSLGYSSYFLDFPLKNRILCSDFSRRKLKYKDESGTIVIDPEMTKLSDLLFKSIREKNKELTIQYSNELNEKISKAEPSQLTYFMDLASKFSQQDLEVLRMFNGEKNDFFHDILRHICCKLI